MAMNYTTLTASKTTPGSLASWVNYSKLDVTTVLDEAQALLYSLLRTREMVTRSVFTMDVGDVFTALPSRFLDPIGRMYAPTLNLQFRYEDISTVDENRIYNSFDGSFGTDPFATTSGSSNVSVTVVAHGFNQGSLINIAGAAAVGGITPNGTFDVVDITDDDTFVIDCGSVGTASSTTTGGGAAATYTVNVLQQGSPLRWTIWNEQIQFDFAFNEKMAITLTYYQSLPLLSSSNQTNFLTNRYPQLLRTACVASAADFMKDTEEYNKGVQRLTALVQNTNVENDMHWRSMELDTETP